MNATTITLPAAADVTNIALFARPQTLTQMKLWTCHHSLRQIPQKYLRRHIAPILCDAPDSGSAWSQRLRNPLATDILSESSTLAFTNPHGTPVACVLVTLLTLALTHPHTVLGSNPNPNPNPKTRIGGVCINHRPSRRTHDLHQAYDTPRGFD